MKNAKHPSLLIAAVLAGLPAASAFGQAQLNTSGHLLDANPLVGSGGVNARHSVNVQNFNGDIWTGNVSGLNYFHGRQGEINPGVIQVGTGTENSDTLNRLAAPVNTLQRTTGTPNYDTFIPTAQAAISYNPAQFKTTEGGQGLVPATRVDPLVPDMNTRIDPMSVTDQSTLPTQGSNGPAGPVNPTAVPKAGGDSLYDLSPLYGVRKSDGAIDGTDARSLQTGSVQNNTPNLSQLRDELNKNPVDQGNDANTGGTKSVDGMGATNLTNTQPLSGTAPFNDAVASQSPLSDAVGGGPHSTSLQSGESFITSRVIPPEKQSAQLAQLMRKYTQQGKPANAVEAAERNNKINAMVNAAAVKPPVLPGGPDDLNPAARLNGPANGGLINGVPSNGVPPVPPVSPDQNRPAVTPTEHPAVADDKPIVITSLAAGMNARGMSNLMKQAEEKMRAGKFTDASGMYDSAERVAPNNPFAPLGRGFAELGSSYYAKADADLNRAVAEQPAILGARYDLNGFLGETRLQFVQKDLADLSNSEKGTPGDGQHAVNSDAASRPEVLLAFIAHNTGDDIAAASHLDAATSRGGDTALVEAMRSVWKMPAKAGK